MGKKCFKMSRLATSAQMLTYLYYKNKSFSRKAVDVLFGNMWVGKGIKSKSNQIKWAHKIQKHSLLCNEHIYRTVK